MFFKGKKILVLGGTGTIGTNIVKSLLLESPAEIRIFSRDEYKQHILRNELGSRKNVRYLIGDIRNFNRVYEAMDGIDYTFHLAAMKHVWSCENNPYEAVLTNIYGTYNVVKAALSQKVKKVVFTSSDKAISPTNTYGATKLTAERILTSAEFHNKGGQTVFASVRFGNVMGSRGSVIPLFKKQVVENKRITLTDGSMTRFMMTLDQATNLTIKALKTAKGGEVFVLKMPVINLNDLAAVIIQETCKSSGIREEEVSIDVVGLLPGEKKYEELMTYEESLTAWDLPGMYVIPSDNNNKYEEGQRAKSGTYSSSDQKPISKKELLELLESQKLI